MKKQLYFLLVFLLTAYFAGSGCKGRRTEGKSVTAQVPAAPVKVGNETTLLLKDLETNGDYVNSQAYPSLIKASIVFEELGTNVLVIDLRINIRLVISKEL